jgi:DNA-directed RNA polymerase specialized sigma24 family protein
MSPRELLATIAAGGTAGNRAATDLRAWLMQRARGRLPVGVGAVRGSVRIPDEDGREDVVQSVLLKLLTKLQDGSLAVLEKPDAAVECYVLRMLANRYLDVCRRAGRELVLPDRVDGEGESRPARELETKPQPWAEQHDDPRSGADEDRWRRALDGGQFVDHVQRLFDRVTGVWLEELGPRVDRAQWNRIVAGLADIVFDGLTMDDVLRAREGLVADAPPTERHRLRTRLYKSHERLRDGIRRTAVVMSTSGALPELDAQLVVSAVDHLLVRRQKRGGDASSE